MISAEDRWLDNLKEGSEVAIYLARGVYEVATVIRRLKLSLEVLPKGTQHRIKFNSRTGKKLKGTSWDFQCLEPLTPEILASIELRKRQAALKRMLSDLDVYQCTLEQCERLLEVFEELNL